MTSPDYKDRIETELQDGEETRHGSQVSRLMCHKQTNRLLYPWPPTRASGNDYYTRGRPCASGNDYYTRGRPCASGNKQTDRLLYPWLPTRASGKYPGKKISSFVNPCSSSSLTSYAESLLQMLTNSRFVLFSSLALIMHVDFRFSLLACCLVGVWTCLRKCLQAIPG